MRETGEKKRKEGSHMYVQRVYRDVHCICTRKRSCDHHLSVRSLLSRSLAVSQSCQTHVSTRLILRVLLLGLQSPWCMRLREEPWERIQFN